ncbi:MAG: hypothetical protein ABF381_15255 [Akkermansiaceae bacterium]
MGTTMIIFSFPASAQKKLSERKKADTPKARVVVQKNPQGLPLAKFKSDTYESERILHDLDGDGWCDIWCSLFKNKIDHRSKKTDTDGDGLTDYEEMVLMRNPSVAEKEPRKMTPKEVAQVAKNAKLAKKKTEQEQARLRKMLEPFMVQGDPKPINRVQRKAARVQKKQADLAALRQKVVAKKAASKALIQKLGIPRQGQLLNGENYFLESDGKGIFQKQSHNALSADSISTDEVLPFNAALANAGLGGNGSSGFDLTGAGLTLGMWDERDPLLNHSFYTGRVFDRDGSNPNGIYFHATHVAGTLVSNGNGALTGRGMSIASDLDAYDFIDDLVEIPTAVGNGLTLSNHSYGISHGWNGQIFFCWSKPLGLVGRSQH